MAIKTQPSKKEPTTSIKWEVKRPKVAGIDISKTEHQVCVPTDLCPENNNRAFGAFTKDLLLLVAWLKSLGIEAVAMEATGVYWIPLANLLKKKGIEVVLVNPGVIKNRYGRKTDQNDAEWIMQLFMCGFLKGSFLPDAFGTKLKTLYRYRNNMVRSRSQCILHMQKCMERMNIKLDNAISDITGKTGMAIIGAILDGKRDPHELASLADSRCKSSKETIADSLMGTWDEELLFELGSYFKLYHNYDNLIKECDQKLCSVCAEYFASVADLPDPDKIERSKKAKNKKTSVGWDVELASYEVWGTNVKTIPGLSDVSILHLMSELGRDWISKFETDKHFCAWLNLVPNSEITGGRVTKSKMRKRINPCGQIFRVAANSLLNNKGSLGDLFRHVRSKKGHFQAIVIVAHKLAKQFYHMVRTKASFNEDLLDIASLESLEKKEKGLEKALAETKGKIKKKKTQMGLPDNKKAA